MTSPVSLSDLKSRVAPPVKKKKSSLDESYFKLSEFRRHDGYWESLFTFGRIPLLKARFVQATSICHPNQEYQFLIRDYDSGRILYEGSIYKENDLYDFSPHEPKIKTFCYECIIKMIERLKNSE